MMLLKEGDSKSVSQIGKEIDEARKRIRQKKEWQANGTSNLLPFFW